MDIDRIKSVIDLMCERELCEFAIEEKDFKLSLKRGSPAVMMSAPMMAPAAAPAANIITNITTQLSTGK